MTQPRCVAMLGRVGLQVEHLYRDIAVGVDAAVEGAHLAVHDALDDPDEPILRRMLEVQPRVAKALMFPHLRKPSLGRREAVLESADDYVRAGELGSRPGRAASELLLVEPDHLTRYLCADGGLVVGGLGRLGYGRAIH